MEVDRDYFFVYLVESPSPADLYVGRSESELIKKAVELNQIHCIARTAINEEAFRIALFHGLTEAMDAHPRGMPLLHISAHGGDEGIQLSDGHVLTWEHLKQLLRPINEALGGALIVCMSSCKGFSGIKMAMDGQGEPLPYFALVGCNAAPTWSETAIGYATLYHQLSKDIRFDHAVQAMRVASANGHFELEHAERARATFIELIESYDPKVARADLEQVAEDDLERHGGALKLLNKPKASPVT